MEAAANQGDPLIGTLIAEKYKILSKLGTGGMGGIYKAEQLPINRVVALKILRHQLREDETLIKRFHHEARTASKLTHPNAVTLFDFGLEAGRPYLVMEFIEGRTLKSVISEDKRLDLVRVKSMMRQICGALNEAHTLGIIHRDIKPDNIMIRRREDGSEWVKVLDFGIAKTIGSSLGNLEANLTQVGTIVGTPQYMSPEQCHGKDLDQRSDIFSLGIVLYEMLSGEIPFQAPSVLELMVKVINSPAEPIGTRHPELYLPEEIDKIVMKALEKEVDNRYQTVFELLEDIERVFPEPTRTMTAARTGSLSVIPEPIPPPKSKGLLIGGLAAAALVIGGVLYFRSTPEPLVNPNNAGVEENRPPDPKVLARVKELILHLKGDQEDKRLSALQELITLRTPEALEAVQTYTIEEERRRQDLASKAEAEKQEALKRAAEMEREAQRLQELASKAQAENAELARQQQAAEAEAEKQRQDAEVKAEAARKESARLMELAAKAEAERAQMAKRAQEAASAGLAAQQEAQRQAEAAKAEAERLAAQAKKAEADRIAMLEQQKKEAEERATRDAADRLQREAEAKKREQEAKEKAEAAKAEASRLNEQAKRADESKRLEQERAVQAAKQRAAVKKAEEERAAAVERERQARERARQQQEAVRPPPPVPSPQMKAAPPPPPPPPDEEQPATDAPKKRRRCGPSWCS